MSISLKSQKMLWGRAAGRCSLPECRLDLYEDETETDDPTLVGENCHIVAESDDGPRPNPDIPVEKRNTYANLILLCRNHHKVIDAQEGRYTVEFLHRIKNEHEAWVREQLGLDTAKQEIDERYAGLIDTWQRLAHVENWLAWSSSVLSGGQPTLRREISDDLDELRHWLLNRVWPRYYPGLERSFENFRRVLEDFYNLFHRHAEPVGDGHMLLTRKFYQIDEWNDERYQRLFSQYEFHVDLVQDLMLELCRAANLICDRVRETFMSGFMLSEGRLMIQSGPSMSGAFREHVVEYSEEEINQELPYASLQQFMNDRVDRDYHFGEGTAP
ncbi:MAG: HNH endonuclease [Alphaproteobacteria bacterium]|nr:HNH endonuclease [Alphaproteobacteria bacterium]